MKIYKRVNHVAFDHASNKNTELQKAIANIIDEHQNNGLQSEVQYSTCATSNTIVYSALILGYTDE